MKIIYHLSAALFLAMAGGAHADMPIFSAKCPLQNNIDGDRTGTVRVNGSVADVKKFNEQYYEAAHDGFIFSISTEADGSGLIVSYSGPGRANGSCTILASSSGPTQGATAGARSEPSTSTQNVRFDAGSSGAELTGTLSPGSSIRYVLGASKGQDLYVRVAARDPDVYYQIFNPDSSFLLDQISSDKEYRGELWQSGNHVVEVINRGNADASFNVILGIE